MSRVIYDKDQEKYFSQDEDGNLKELLRVTQLLAKHGLSVNYDDVPEHIMESARIFGEIHHAWLDKYFKGLASEEDLPDITKEGLKTLKTFGISPFISEQRVHNDFLAGTVDLIGLKDDDPVIVDFKFTYNFNYHSVMWQTNVYRVLARTSLGIEIKRLYCLWYNKPKGEFELKELPLLDDILVYELFAAELDGEIFIEEQNTAIAKVERELAIDKEFAKFYEAERYVNQLKTNIELIKDELVKEMVAHGLKTYETKHFKITLVGESTTSKVDFKKVVETELKDKKIDLEKYTTTSTRKAHLKIYPKEEKVWL